MSIDHLIKELIKAFPGELLELFLPHIAARIDFKRIEFMDKEVFTDVVEGRRREPDIVAKVHTIEGQPELLLFHIEIQSRKQRKFPYRMFEYYALLRLRHKLPVYPIVVYLAPGTGALHIETYEEEVFGRKILHFEYDALGLPDLSAEEYLEKENPLAPALSAVMKPGHLSKAMRKLLSLKRVLAKEIDEARKSLLVNVIEEFLPLKEEDEVEFNQLVTATQSVEVIEMMTVYEERGMQKGIEKGIAEGIEKGIAEGIEKGIAEGIEKGIVRGVLEGKKDTLLHQLHRKFGELPQSVEIRVRAIEIQEELDVLLERILTANSLAEMELE
jgi:predicted transposase/invertase (TIGR01784 family)